MSTWEVWTVWGQMGEYDNEREADEAARRFGGTVTFVPSEPAPDAISARDLPQYVLAAVAESAADYCTWLQSEREVDYLISVESRDQMLRALSRFRGENPSIDRDAVNRALAPLRENPAEAAALVNRSITP